MHLSKMMNSKIYGERIKMKENMKDAIVLMFHDSGLSGGTLALLDLIEKWSATNEYKYICVLPKNNIDLEEELIHLNCEVITFRFWQAVWNCSGNKIKLLVLRMKYILGFINTIFFYKKIKKYSIKAVYSNTSSIYNGLLLSKLLKVKHIWHIREFVAKEHGVYPIWGEKYHYKTIENAQKYKNKIIFISKSLEEDYKMHLELKNTTIIYDDVSPKYWIKNLENWEQRKNNILVVGNISQGKRQMDIIEAFFDVLKTNKDITLFFAGKATDEDYFSLIKEKIKQLQIEEKVVFLGQVNQMNDVRKNMGIGIVSSYKEAFGRVTIEGMLAGMIIIGSNDSGTKELIRDKENGYLYSLGNISNLAEVVKEVLNSPNESNEKIIERARISAKKYINGKCASEIYKMF